jgi:HK97 gp10 family phage protein
MSEIQVRLNLEAPQLFKTKVGQAVKEVFQLDILPEAIKNSPVTPEGVEYNLAKHPNLELAHMTKNGKVIFNRTNMVPILGTGHNRQSLDVEFTETPSGPEAKLFGQSGYSGYLEVGTSKMRAQPYIWPAWLKFKDKIIALIRSR